MTAPDADAQEPGAALCDAQTPSPDVPADLPASAADATRSAPKPDARGLRRLLLLFIAVAAIACAVLLCLSWPVSQAPFRLYATTSFLGMKAASDFHISVAAKEWDVSIAPAKSAGSSSSSSQSAKFAALRRVIPDDAKAPQPDILDVWVHAGDEVIVQRLPGLPARYSITLPSQPAELTAQLADGTHLGQTDETGKETTDPNPDREFRSNIGGTNQPALRVLPAEGRGELGERAAVSLLGFGRPKNQSADAGLLSGSMQFLDTPESELKLYRGTDLRLGNVDGEVSAAVLTSDAIEVSASGLVDNVEISVSTHSARNESRNIMPSRYEWLKGQPVIAVGLGFLATVVGTIGLLLSAAGAIPSFNRWLHRVVRQEK